MRIVSDFTKAAWRARVKAGDKRPVVRATVQRGVLRQIPYDTEDAPGGDYNNDRDRNGVFTTFLHGGTEPIIEVRNIKSISWTRGVDQEIAECTLTILNTELNPIGATNRYDQIDNPGIFSPIRGNDATAAAKQRWGFDVDEGWNWDLQPDRLLRTFEGYGSDPSVAPGDDPHMYLSGTWIIDDIEYNANGDMVIKARDAGRLLLDQITFPPVIPPAEYPVSWQAIRSEEVPARAPTGGSWQNILGNCYSSNSFYVGAGLVDSPEYVAPNGHVLGTGAHMAIAAKDDGAYWLSTGQVSPQSTVWWQVDLKEKKHISAIRVSTKKGPYRVYVSLWNGSRWLGKRVIPYSVTTGGVNLGANIPYVDSFRPTSGHQFDWVFRRRYKNVVGIRLTFTDLRAYQPGVNYPWRAGLKTVKIYAGAKDKLKFDKSGTILRPVGNINDISSIVKWVCAWGGFYWAYDDPQLNYIRWSTYGPRINYGATSGLVALPKGRVWGQFQRTYTKPVADLTAETFDKQPLLDHIREAKNISGFNFWVDEIGAIVWRLPNLYSFGNYVSHSRFSPPNQPTRTTEYVTLDETTDLLEYAARTSSRNLRERVAVTDVAGKIGAVTEGYRPPTGPSPELRRLAMWSDAHFGSDGEALVAADLIASRQMFDFRRAKVTIWGNPAIQIDDQIRIFERTTNETYFHYVSSISSNLNMEEGTWEYNLETHWLGQNPDDAWLLDRQALKAETRSYLALLGGVD